MGPKPPSAVGSMIPSEVLSPMTWIDFLLEPLDVTLHITLEKFCMNNCAVAITKLSNLFCVHL